MKKLFLIIFLICLSISVSQGQEEKAVTEGFVYDDGGRRDPFWPLLSVNGSLISYNEKDLDVSDLVLQGIIAGSDGNVAVINGKIVTKGDMVGAYVVEAIMPTFIKLDSGQEKIELHLSKKGE